MKKEVIQGKNSVEIKRIDEIDGQKNTTPSITITKDKIIFEQCKLK